MLTKRLIYVVLFCMTSFHVIAQDSLLLRDYNYVKQQDIWLSQPNLAALTRFATANIVEAEASLTKGNGDFVNYYESSNTLQGNIHMESLYRLNQRIVFFGAIKYNNWSGRNMTGSAFIIPERRPFNLVEDSLTNAGKKHRDTYQLTGGLGIDVWQGLSLGVRIDYTSANYAKYKDLRHKNKLMDLQLTAGFYAPVTPWLNIGADYRYHRNTETVEFATYGKGDKVYKTLIDYGAFMGIIEQFGNEGYTDKTREMPLFEDAHGGSLQLEVVPAEALSIYGSFAFSHATGYYGRKSPYTITYTNHYRDKIKAIAALTYHHGTSSHRLDFSYQTEKLGNNTETFRGLTNANGATYYEYYDPTETADKRWQDVQLGYTAHWGIRHELPIWSLTAAYQWIQRRQTVYLYPFFRQQKLSYNKVSLSATYNLVTTKGVWSFLLTGAFQKGSGEPYEDGAFVTTASQQPATMEAFLQQEYLYLTAAQYEIGAKAKYAFIFPGTHLKTHAALGIHHRKSNETNAYLNGQQHTQLSVAVGCTF